MAGSGTTHARRGALRVGLAAVAVLVVGVGIVAAGTPARGLVVADTSEMLRDIPHQIDPGTFPAITIDQGVADYDHSIDAAGAQQILMTLGENLELENQALLRSDAALLTAVDHGDRLKEMQDRLAQAKATGRTILHHYAFDDVHVGLIVPFGVQTGTSLGFESSGTVTEETYDASGALMDRTTAPFERTFVVRRATGDRWLNVADLATPPGG